MTATSPAFVLLPEAEKLAKVSRRTIDRDIKNGKIHQSQIRKERNRKRISVAELERVYGGLTVESETAQDISPKVSKVDQDILDILERQLEEEKARSRKAQDETKAWQERYLSAQERLNGFLLPAPREEKRGLFRGWFRKG